MSEHTPKSWVVEPAGQFMGLSYWPITEKIGDKSYGWVGLAWTEANADLIAAAPDMLEALEGAVCEAHCFPHTLRDWP